MSKPSRSTEDGSAAEGGHWREIAQLWSYQFSYILKKKSQCCCQLCFSHDNKLQVIFVQRFECLLALFPFLVWLSALAIKSIFEVLWLSQPPAGMFWKSLFWGYCCSSWYESFTKVPISCGHFCFGLTCLDLMNVLSFIHDCSGLWEASKASLCKVWSAASRWWGALVGNAESPASPPDLPIGSVF